jgi:hypothetical protein
MDSAEYPVKSAWGPGGACRSQLGADHRGLAQFHNGAERGEGMRGLTGAGNGLASVL